MSRGRLKMLRDSPDPELVALIAELPVGYYSLADLRRRASARDIWLPSSGPYARYAVVCAGMTPDVNKTLRKKESP